jgi:hypothetical protein
MVFSKMLMDWWIGLKHETPSSQKRVSRAEVQPTAVSIIDCTPSPRKLVSNINLLHIL